MAKYNDFLSWRELRPLRVKLFFITLGVDILLWELFIPGFQLLPIDLKTGEINGLALINYASFIIDSVVITILTSLFCHIIIRYATGKERNFTRAFLYRLAILMFALLLSGVLSLIYLALHWESMSETYLTVLTCTIISQFVGDIYFSYKGTYENDSRERRIQALQNKIIFNNHFELNAISHVKAMIISDPEGAEELLDALSEYHKYVVNGSKNSWVTVNKEIEFFQTYIYIMHIRFPEGFKAEIDQNVFRCMKKVPVTSLQIVAENAVKHNIIDKNDPLVIKVYLTEDENFICIENNLKPVIGQVTSSKTGIKLIQDCYVDLGMSVNIHKSDSFYKIELPLI